MSFQLYFIISNFEKKINTIHESIFKFSVRHFGCNFFNELIELLKNWISL